jgi:cell division protein FtsN
MLPRPTPHLKLQAGGTVMGIIIGLVVGLGIALAVAMYVTKAPIKFAQKTQTRSAEQDAQEAKKNKDWDPNAPLYGKNPARPAAAASAATPAPASTPAPSSKSADPLGDLAKEKAQPASEPAGFYVQTGAFRSTPEAEAQRAKLALQGVDAKIVERTQGGQTVFRVRVGPYEKREEADKTKQKIDAAGMEALVVRTGR